MIKVFMSKPAGVSTMSAASPIDIVPTSRHRFFFRYCISTSIDRHRCWNRSRIYSSFYVSISTFISEIDIFQVWHKSSLRDCSIEQIKSRWRSRSLGKQLYFLENFGDLEIRKTNRSFWKKNTFLILARDFGFPSIINQFVWHPPFRKRTMASILFAPWTPNHNRRLIDGFSTAQRQHSKSPVRKVPCFSGRILSLSIMIHIQSCCCGIMQYPLTCV